MRDVKRWTCLIRDVDRSLCRDASSELERDDSARRGVRLA